MGEKKRMGKKKRLKVINGMLRNRVQFLEGCNAGQRTIINERDDRIMELEARDFDLCHDLASFVEYSVRQFDEKEGLKRTINMLQARLERIKEMCDGR